jgi:hypothetical protein
MRYDPTVPEGDRLRDIFNPLLRNLLEADLVVPVDDPDGRTWQLVQQAQRRLDELAPGEAPLPEDLVYFDHRCWTCGEQRATYFVGERYLCARCRREEAEAEAVAAAAAEALRQAGAAPDERERGRRWAHLPWAGRTFRRAEGTSDITLYRASPGEGEAAAAASSPPGPHERAS